MLEVSQILRSAGLRVTSTRVALFQAMLNQKPQDAQTLLKALCKQRKGVHKTTIYRDLEVFLHVRLILAVQFGDGLVRYELAQQPHHHHLICKGCGRVEDVQIAHKFERIEKNLVKKFHFTQVEHALEFYGKCTTCFSLPRNQ